MPCRNTHASARHVAGSSPWVLAQRAEQSFSPIWGKGSGLPKPTLPFSTGKYTRDAPAWQDVSFHGEGAGTAGTSIGLVVQTDELP